MYYIGTWYYNGKGGLKQDNAKSFQLQYSAATLGHSLAMYNVATAFLQGDGVSRNVQQAVDWYERVARTGMVKAVVNLGIIYRDGTGGVKPDLERARQLFSQLAGSNEICRELLEHTEKLIREEGKK